MRDHQRLFPGILVAVFLGLLPASTIAADRPNVFEIVGIASAGDIPGQARGLASLGRLNPGALAEGRIVLSLPGIGDRTATLSRRVDRAQGLTWVGELDAVPGSMVALTLRRGVLAGYADDGRQIYEFAPARGGLHVIYALDESSLPPLEPDVLPQPEETAGGSVSGETVAAEAANVQDLLVVYTPASRNRYGQAGIENRIISAVEAANQAYLNSQVDQQLNLVYLGEIEYTETGNMSDALSRLRSPGDGYMDEVHALRDTHGADLVALVDEDTNYCGIGYVMTNVSTSFAPYAFSVTLSSCLAGQTLAHELGHNQGNMHDRANSSNEGAFPYSYGYRRCVSGDGFRTVMAYSCTGGTRVSHFSNPDVTYNGYPTGVDHDLDPVNSADASRSMDLTASTIAALRASVSTTPPAAPSALGASPASHERIDLSWTDNASDETGFRLDRSPDGTSWTEIATLGQNVITWADTGLAANTAYSYRVRAYNGAGASAWSNTGSATTLPPPPPPSMPTGLAAVGLTGSEIRLSWSDVADETGYELERATAATGPWSSRATLPAETVSFTDGGLGPGETWHYRIAAVNDSGSSGFTASVEATTLTYTEHFAQAESTAAGSVSGTLADTLADDGMTQRITEIESGGKPSRRTSMAEHAWEFDVSAGTTVTLTANAWVEGSAGEDGFGFAWSADGTNYEPMFVVSDGDPAGVYQHPLPASAAGRLWVRARDTNRDEGARSFETLNVDTLVIRTESDPNAQPPAAPADALAVSTSASRVTVTWTDQSADESGFRLERHEGGAWTSIGSTGADATVYEDTSVAPNTTYTYRVAAFNGAGLSGWIEAPPVTTPDGLTLSASGYKVKGIQHADLAWSGAGGPVDVLRDGAPIGLGDSTGGSGSYTDLIGGKGGGAYAYQVCDAGSSRCSDPVTVAF
jgi:hypothetical protein